MRAVFPSSTICEKWPGKLERGFFAFVAVDVGATADGDREAPGDRFSGRVVDVDSASSAFAERDEGVLLAARVVEGSAHFDVGDEVAVSEREVRRELGFFEGDVEGGVWFGGVVAELEHDAIAFFDHDGWFLIDF